jgi:hypothetical protein
MEVGRVTDAIREFDRSTDVLPLNAGSQFALAKAMIIDGNPNAAAQRYDAALDLTDTPGLRDNITVNKAAVTGKNAGADKAIQNPKFGVPSQNDRRSLTGFARLNRATRKQSRARWRN